MSRILAVIPARYASTRFPGKPLVDILGKSMIQRVYEQCQQVAAIDQVGVATDDERIYAHVQSFGGTVWMTSPDHRSGTDRIAEVAAKESNYDFVINVQGDEPFLPADHIQTLCELLTEKKAPIATLGTPLRDENRLHDPNVVKLVRTETGEALYFSRAPIPYFRNDEKQPWTVQHAYWKHLGLYGFRRETLLALSQLPPHRLEMAESLEQLRWLGHGYAIHTAIVEGESEGIDTPEDLHRLLAQLDQNAS